MTFNSEQFSDEGALAQSVSKRSCEIAFLWDKCSKSHPGLTCPGGRTGRGGMERRRHCVWQGSAAPSAVLVAVIGNPAPGHACLPLLCGRRTSDPYSKFIYLRAELTGWASVGTWGHCVTVLSAASWLPWRWGKMSRFRCTVGIPSTEKVLPIQVCAVERTENLYRAFMCN